MKLSSYIILSSLLIVFISCKEEKKTSKLIINFDHTEAETYNIYSIANNIFTSVTKGDSIAEINLEEPSFLTLGHKYSKHHIYLKPGEQLQIDTLMTAPLVLGATGNISPENAFLNGYVKTTNNLNYRDLGSYFGKPADSFELFVKGLNKPLMEKLNMLEAASPDLEPSFLNTMRKKIQSDIAKPYISYSQNYYGLENFKIPDAFQKIINAIDMKDEAYLNFSENMDVHKKWVAKDINYDEYDAVDNYFGAIQKTLDSTFANTEIGGYYRYTQLLDDVNFGKGIDKSQEAINHFKSTVSNSALLSLLNNATAPWEPLKAGKKAPDFEVTDVNGNKVSLKDLRGKRVYIDVWATWCGPCKAEIPSLKKLEKDLHDSPIQFVSISIDEQKDHQKWADFIADEDLGGLQLITDNGWKSSLMKDYNISGIPRFLLIDADGSILNANAPRPSDKSIKEVLLN